jgi:hypothetical protein
MRVDGTVSSANTMRGHLAGACEILLRIGQNPPGLSMIQSGNFPFPPFAFLLCPLDSSERKKSTLSVIST